MRRSIIYCLLLLPLTVLAQEWDWEAPVRPARKTTYHDILLPPELVCRLNPEFGNLRLYDGSGEEVPYLFFSEGHVDQEVSLKWYPRVREDYWRRWYSRSYFRNAKADLIDRMVLKIRNADVRQKFWLSGSDDMNRWYIVKEDFVYDSDYDPASSYNLLTIDFPPVDYKYYKVEIRHHWHEPIQIMGAGYYSVSESEGHYQPVPRPLVAQKEDGTRSVVDIRFNASHYVDRLFFEIDGPEMYHRDARLELKEEYGGYRLLESFVLDSRSVNLLTFESLRGQDLRLVIENRDDKPLRAAAVQALQLRKYVTAKLKKGDSTVLRVGPEHLRSPVYDLAYFTSDLPGRRPASRPGPVIDLRPPPPPPDTAAAAAQPSSTPPTHPQPTAATTPEPEPAPGENKVFLWVGIVLIVVLLGFMSMRMLRDMNEPEEADQPEA